MFNRRFKSILLSGVTVLAAMSAAGAAQAAGTVSGTSIVNQATVTYTVGGTNQTVASNNATFVVDKKVNLTVAMVGTSATATALGATDAVTTFTVTNLTNSVQDFRLTPSQDPISVPLLGTDNFDVTNMRVFVDSNGNGTYDPGVDTATFIDELAPDTSATVFIVANVPNVAGENTAIVFLKATTAAGGGTGALGADVQATIGADSPTVVDVVFADGLGPVDLARDGAASAADAYVISTAAVTLTKSLVVVSDPVNLAVLPKAIPGATVRYCIVVANAGPGIATGVNVADVVPANMTYVPNSASLGLAAGNSTCITSGVTLGTSFDTTNNTVHGTFTTVVPNVSQAVTFLATVN